METDATTFDAFVGPVPYPDGGPTSDDDLMRRVVAGSQDALAGLYDRHAQTVFAAAMRASRDRWIAAEVVQETFLALWSRAELFDPSRGALPAWLTRIARNRAVDHLRVTGRRERAAVFSSFGRPEVDDHSIVDWLATSGELLGTAGQEPGPEHAFATKETRASIQDAIASLAPLERCVISLAYDAGLSQPEIAAQTGWPIGTVKTRTRRALRHLREELTLGPGPGSSDDASTLRSGSAASTAAAWAGASPCTQAAC